MGDSRSIIDCTGPEPDEVLRYDPRDTGVVEVWHPVGPSRDATVVLVHGGFWQPDYDRLHLRPLAGALARDGWSVASVEYARARMPGGGWPGTGADVLAGIDAVQALGALPERLLLVGHSAGGHLAVWAASEGRVDPLLGVVSLAGVVDLHLARRLRLGDDAVLDLMAGAEDPVSWADADPAAQRLTAPAVLIHGDQDRQVPLAVSEAYLASRLPEDAPSRLEGLPGVGHFELIDPDQPAFDVLGRALGELAARVPDAER